MPTTKTTRIAIIGAGPSGIAAGRELLQKGFSQFTIFDALDAPGGTWRLHSYPGLACDVWAHYDDSGVWRLHSTEGEQWEFDTVINAMGNQHTHRCFPMLRAWILLPATVFTGLAGIMM